MLPCDIGAAVLGGEEAHAPESGPWRKDSSRGSTENGPDTRGSCTGPPLGAPQLTEAPYTRPVPQYRGLGKASKAGNPHGPAAWTFGTWSPPGAQGNFSSCTTGALRPQVQAPRRFLGPDGPHREPGSWDTICRPALSSQNFLGATVETSMLARHAEQARNPPALVPTGPCTGWPGSPLGSAQGTSPHRTASTAFPQGPGHCEKEVGLV